MLLVLRSLASALGFATAALFFIHATRSTNVSRGHKSKLIIIYSCMDTIYVHDTAVLVLVYSLRFIQTATGVYPLCRQFLSSNECAITVNEIKFKRGILRTWCPAVLWISLAFGITCEKDVFEFVKDKVRETGHTVTWPAFKRRERLIENFVE